MTPLAAFASSSDPRPAVAAFLVLFALFFCGCKGKTPPKPLGTGTADFGVPGGSSELDDEAAAVERLEENFARVHFDFDSARLTESAGALLDENAQILARHPELVVEIQGHADPRGTTGYNLALGTMRAGAAQSRLMARGISSSRIPTVTYGEERPREAGDDESAHAANRRVEFRVVRGGADGVAGTTR